MYKKIIEGKKAVIFDLDGTVVETTELWRDAFNNIFSGLELEIPLSVEFPTGLPTSELWLMLLHTFKLKPNLTLDELVKQTQIEYLKLTSTTPPKVKDGFWSIAAELKTDKGLKLGLVTNTHRTVTDQILNQMEIGDTFDFSICGNEVTKTKPNPEIYRKALKTLGMKANEVLVFEDTVTGAKSSVQAKLDTVVVWNGEISKKAYPKDVLGFIPDFTELIGNLDDTLKEKRDRYIEQDKKATVKRKD